LIWKNNLDQKQNSMKKLLIFGFLLAGTFLLGQKVKSPGLTSGLIYSWEKPHAKVLENGDLEWQPEDFEYVKGSSMRYIDFEEGSDTNDGKSTKTAWKHHPWDPAATGKAQSASGIYTYVFKRGVVYRGLLTAKESGEPGNPIRLTSDPSWGKGEAGMYGSIRLTS
jgi:hypothetical protein